ncbi:hypothetical protein [Flavilitoribacter nigricans]|uniref:Phage major capsid protein n=1 Tax=Flavilitoribacter nigricans (strain ATCC 23147 / DSM 23189 / NBRC 102662 / NCIMB 1420 / SS-2) TaxID=1122177 RepID=A0A2D0NEQ0_FLAN2|nr:hypothetical protein [Flavilitoribacter nigricans]PHN06955.1 hypothetical protein CRP01_09065 [Flavilitoribacter nigricans DSM 23189 = NBRC 102662]
MAHSISIEATAATLNQVAVTYDRTIHQSLKQGLEFERDLTFVQTEHTFSAANISITGGLQPYQAAFTPNNEEDFDAVENVLQLGKIDLEFDALQLEEFYASWAPQFFQLDTSPDMWEYARYVIVNHIMPQFMDDLNEASYNGVRVNPTPGTAGTATQSFDGFKTKIAAAITAGSLTPISTGALASDTIHDQVRDFCFQLPKRYRMKKGKLRMASTRALEYAENYAENKPRTVEVTTNPDNPVYRVDHFNKVIVPMDCMEGSDRIIFCPDSTDNMIIGTRTGESVYPRLRFQVFERKLKVLAEFSRFFGVRFWDHMFVNDQA